MSVHPTAILSDHVELADGVEIGPYAILEGKVKVGRGTKIGASAIIGYDNGIVEIGEENTIMAHAYVGGPPQDSSFRGETTALKIGDRNVIREFVTINTGTHKEDGLTVIGDDCMLMTYVHIAHDCKIGNRVIIANAANFAGHVHVADDVRIGGDCNFAQFIRLGRHSYIAGDTTANKDILPFSIAEGKWAVCRATNRIGLERAGLSKDKVSNIHKAIRFVIMGGRTLDEALEKIQNDCESNDEIEYLVNFIKESEKGIARNN